MSKRPETTKPPEVGSRSQPFPLKRPEIVITPSKARPFAISSRLLPGWGVPLDRVGRTGWVAWYDPPEWSLTSVSHMSVTREAEVHRVGGVEVEMFGWEGTDRVWKPEYTHYVRLTDEAIQWLATAHIRDGKRIICTFLDDEFESDWGECPRQLKDTGRLAPDAHGGYRLRNTRAGRIHDVFGAGMFRVRVGQRSFTCLRVIDIAIRTSPRQVSQLEREILAESYYTQSDRLVLFRRHNGRLWKTQRKGPYAGTAWDQRLPDNARLVINGATFVHWYDCLTDVACALP